MSKIICSAAIRGAHKILDRVDQEWREAMDTWGPKEEVGFPNMAYYLPIIYGILGWKVETLGDMEPVLLQGHPAAARLRERASPLSRPGPARPGARRGHGDLFRRGDGRNDLILEGPGLLRTW